MKYIFLISVLILIVFKPKAFGQSKKVKYDLVALSKKGEFEIFNRKINSFEPNIRAINISENPGDGVLWLKGIDFSNGTIDVDIKGKDVIQQSFVGIAFHGLDNQTLDAVYFRPFNFKTSDSIRHIHSVQYVSHPVYTWDKLRVEKTGLYEKQVASAPNPNSWFHAKIVVDYPNVKVFVNNNSEPSLYIKQLNSRKNGKIGLWVGNNSGASFANLEIYNE